MRKLVYTTIILLCFLLFLEITFRILGFSPLGINQKIVSKPEICYSTDSLGITLKEGNYKINIDNCIEYYATHNREGRRITSKTPIISPNKIFVFGCSFAYGVGINDKDTFPFLLQNLVREYEVDNYSIPGSGTMQAYLNLKKSLEKGGRPKIVVLSYATFHEERNQLTRSFESKLFEGIKFHKDLLSTKFFYPRCIIKNKNMTIEYVDIVKDFFPIPLVKYLAIATFVDQIWNEINYKTIEGFPVSKIIFKDFQKLAEHYDFKLIIADVSYNKKSNEIETFCLVNNLKYLNISPDYSKANYSLEPCDFHPNQLAHEIYAHKLYEYIKTIK